MDFQGFITALPHLYNDWGQASVHPKSIQFQQLLKQIGGTTTANVMQLLNLAVDCMEHDEVYCEFGCSQGSNLIGALYNRLNSMAYAVDLFSDNLTEDNLTHLTRNVSNFDLEERVLVCDQEWEEFLFELREIETENKIGVFYYNTCNYRSQLLALLLVKPFLANRALIVIGNSNSSAVKQATWDFILAQPQAQVLLELPTPAANHCSFWNGIQILSWDSQREYNYDFYTIKDRRDSLFIKTIYNLQPQINNNKQVLEKLFEEAVELEKKACYEQAEKKYYEILLWDKNRVDVLFRLGGVYYKTEQYQKALTFLLQSINIEPQQAIQHYCIGLVLEKLGDTDQAIKAYDRAIALEPQCSDPYIALGDLLSKLGNLEQAELNYRKVIDIAPNDFHTYFNLGNFLSKYYRVEEAIFYYEKALDLKPDDRDTLNNMIVALQEADRMQDAIAFANKAVQTLPEDSILGLKKHLLLPILYETEEEIDFYRKRFTQGLQELIQQTHLDTENNRKSALIAVGRDTTFYLQYQGKNDIELQKQYGQFIHQVMTANFSQWSKPLSMPSLKKGEKIRVGYVSKYMRDHTVGKLMLGWLKNHNKNQFEIYCYHLDSVVDRVTHEFELACDKFHWIADDLETISHQIVSDRLDVLTFLDIGMVPLVSQLAGLRLAPVQCTTWGHPITSGSPTIDYFLSSELMEPENAQQHYTEKLVNLPNIGISYAKPVVPTPTKTRLNFHLRDDAVVYLSCQSLFKYLPQYDYIFAAIAQQVPQAQFVFISHQLPQVTEKFQRRLQRAFARFNLNSTEYCVVLPRQNPGDYLNLNLVSDIFLDTLSWSGGNTTLEAIACNLPIVTCPGEFMRGRHSYGILKMLGVTDTIANSEAEYIEIAVKLGLNREWRDSIVEQMLQRHSHLYDDKTCVTALEEFYCSLI